MCRTGSLVLAMVCALFSPHTIGWGQSAQPNILWIVVEDASAHLGCYGETVIDTPHLDALAETGIRFTNAFVTCPVCSPSRSAMVTGMFQTTLGAHNHRSQSDRGKGRGSAEYFDSYRLPIQSIPRLFQEAGYFTCNSSSGLPTGAFGKTDYNFVWSKSDYDGSDWSQRKAGQPFFAQVQLRGGKNRGAKQHATSAASVQLPPYYPDHPLLRQDWADYLNSWVQCDREVKAILERLDREGIADQTAVFFWTDHGISHVRGKQFLYDEGIHVPLIVRLPQGARAGTVRDDLVLQIDIAATSLALARIEIPPYIQGADLWSANHQPRAMIFSARDRCDETVEIMRCVRTSRFKYIRNFLPHVQHAQPNQYKDGKPIVKSMRRLHAEGRLDELQSRAFTSPRPTEELYDLTKDPMETRNLASDPAKQSILSSMRSNLYHWMISSRDVGLIPEPILEELGKRHGSKYAVLQHDNHRDLIRDLISVIEAGETRDYEPLIQSLESEESAVRYWAASQLGIYGEASHAAHLKPLTKDSSGGVRVASALALCRLGQADQYAPVLAKEMESNNYILGMYAIRALELIGDAAKPYLDEIRAAQQSDYEFTRRIANRLVSRLQ